MKRGATLRCASFSFIYDRYMNKKLMLFAGCAAMLLTGCGGKKERKATSSQLIEQVEQFGIDTIEAKPGETLCSNSVDGVLRHYPELYHATRKAVKAYEKWMEAAKEAGLKVKPQTMDVAALLDEALFSDEAVDADSAWQHLPTIDSLYIQAIVNIPSGQSDTDKRKTAIGRMRKAWQAYAQQLQYMTPTIPQDCTQRYLSTVKSKTKGLTDINLYKQNR